MLNNDNMTFSNNFYQGICDQKPLSITCVCACDRKGERNRENLTNLKRSRGTQTIAVAKQPKKHNQTHMNSCGVKGHGWSDVIPGDEGKQPTCR